MKIGAGYFLLLGFSKWPSNYPKTESMSPIRLIATLLLLCPLLVFAQGNQLPLGNPAYHTLDRLSIKSGIEAPFHPSMRYYSRADAARYAILLDTSATNLSLLDREDLAYIFRDNNEWLGQPVEVLPLAVRRHDKTIPTQIEAALADARYTKSQRPFLNFFYPTPANFIEVNRPEFHLRVNPVIHLAYGQRQDAEDPYFFNQRGVQLRGGIDDRIYLHFDLLETQAALPNYVNDFVARFRAVPGNGLYKDYQSDVFNIERGVDFLNSQGYLGFNLTPHVGLQFGYGRHFIGNGYRSLILSDFANNYLYLKLNWKVWKFHYQNLFAELSPVSARDGSTAVEPLAKKYMAAHYLSINLLPNLTVGLYEAVMFTRNDQFEFQYLNPVILYRSIEQTIGSPDNVLLGANASWNIKKKVQLYGQVMLDEFVFNELFVERRGWWANKFGIQAGAKYIDALGVDHLDLQAEWNLVRPYTYTHRDSSAAYSHLNQSLAHPLGANFEEVVLRARYAPTHRWILEARAFFIRQGEDDTGVNYGANILLPHTSRVQDFGNELFQGVGAETQLIRLDASYQLRHNLFLDAYLLLREKNSDAAARNRSTTLFGLGVRWNAELVRYDF